MNANSAALLLIITINRIISDYYLPSLHGIFHFQFKLVWLGEKKKKQLVRLFGELDATQVKHCDA